MWERASLRRVSPARLGSVSNYRSLPRPGLNKAISQEDVCSICWKEITVIRINGALLGKWQWNWRKKINVPDGAEMTRPSFQVLKQLLFHTLYQSIRNPTGAACFSHSNCCLCLHSTTVSPGFTQWLPSHLCPTINSLHSSYRDASRT